MEAKARLWNVNMSPKFSREVALSIKGMEVGRARKFLEGVVDKDTPVELRRHNKEVPHHRGKPSRYPVKVAKNFLQLLDSAVANANYLGAEKGKLRVSRVEVYRGSHKRTPGAKSLGKAKVRGRRASVLMVLEDEGK
jgi:large subunit ribosomal protein L22